MLRVVVSCLVLVFCGVAGFAQTPGPDYLDYFSAMADEKGFLKDELSNDGLHPNTQGYAVMAPLAEAAIAASLKHGK